ncbi:hypothetical protein [Streptomyces virginiae]|uniref:hypothetical protein n=1 Tax=Streptomyces virginiae TaxID=1961 RepID=UPI002254DAFD|nr:hypothetical protein [Streptomyces virginiae]MCX5178560.1 hypothetical protein [Streptomyces virginiae]
MSGPGALPPIATALKEALRHLRSVRGQRPEAPCTDAAYPAWRDDIAEALDNLAEHLEHLEHLEQPADQTMARAEAVAARAEAERLRA